MEKSRQIASPEFIIFSKWSLKVMKGAGLILLFTIFLFFLGLSLGLAYILGGLLFFLTLGWSLHLAILYNKAIAKFLTPEEKKKEWLPEKNNPLVEGKQYPL